MEGNCPSKENGFNWTLENLFSKTQDHHISQFQKLHCLPPSAPPPPQDVQSHVYHTYTLQDELRRMQKDSSSRWITKVETCRNICNFSFLHNYQPEGEQNKPKWKLAPRWKSKRVLNRLCGNNWQTFQPMKPQNLEVWKMNRKKSWDLGPKPWDLHKSSKMKKITLIVLKMFKPLSFVHHCILSLPSKSLWVGFHYCFILPSINTIKIKISASPHNPPKQSKVQKISQAWFRTAYD